MLFLSISQILKPTISLKPSKASKKTLAVKDKRFILLFMTVILRLFIERTHGVGRVHRLLTYMSPLSGRQQHTFQPMTQEIFCTL